MKLGWVRTGRPVSELSRRRPEDAGTVVWRAANQEQSWDPNLVFWESEPRALCSAKGSGKSEQGRGTVGRPEGHH